MIISGICFTFLNSIVRYVDDMPTFQLVLFRAFGSVLFCLVIIYKAKIPILGNRPKWLILRAIFGLVSMSLFFKAVQMMPVGSAVTLRYISPFFAAILAVIFLKEKMLKIQWACLVIAFVSVAILKGFDLRIEMHALFIILTSAFFSGLVYMVIRKIASTEHPVVVVNYFMCLSLLVSSFACFFKWRSPLLHEWPWLLSMGVFGYYAQLFMTKAMQMEESNQIVPFKYIEVVLTILFAWIIFGESQNIIAFLAIAMIILALIVNVKAKIWFQKSNQ